MRITDFGAFLRFKKHLPLRKLILFEAKCKSLKLYKNPKTNESINFNLLFDKFKYFNEFKY